MERPIRDLAATISKDSNVLCTWLEESGHAQPSFQADSAPAFPQSEAPQEVRKARESLISAANQLYHLAQWPVGAAQNFADSHAFDAAALRLIVKYDVAKHVPLDGSNTFTELAAKVDVDGERLSRILRYAMTSFWFREPEPGRIAHSAMSALLVTNKQVAAQVAYQSQVGVPSSHAWIDSVEASRTDGSYRASPFNIVHGVDQQSMAWAAADPVRSVWFNEMMKAYQQSSAFSLQHTVEGYDWASLGKGLLVDVGGNTGPTACAIAAVAPSLKIVVQDRPGAVADGRSMLPETCKDQVSFQEHDFFQPQPIQKPDAFLLRSICHDWPDADAIAILKNLVPAMGPTTKLILVDGVVPAPGMLPPTAERSIRLLDMVMMTMHNGKERTSEDWKALLYHVDASLRIVSMRAPPGSALSVIEVIKDRG